MKQKCDRIPIRGQAAFTWGLLLVWVLLMLFGAVCYVNPEWLQELSRPGMQVESRSYKNFGDDALRQGKYRQAIANYQQALKIDPNQVRVLVNLALALGKIGDVATGIRILRDALRMDASDSLKGVIHYNLAELLQKHGKTENAVQHYQESRRFYAEQDKVYRKLGLLYLAEERYEEARSAFEMTLASQLEVTLPYVYMLHRSTDIYEDDPTNLRIIEEQLARGIFLEELNRYDVDIIRQLQESDREIAKTHNHLGLICARVGDLGKATGYFQRSLQIWPGNTDAKRNLRLLRELQVNQD